MHLEQSTTAPIWAADPGVTVCETRVTGEQGQVVIKGEKTRHETWEQIWHICQTKIIWQLLGSVDSTPGKGRKNATLIRLGKEFKTPVRECSAKALKGYQSPLKDIGQKFCFMNHCCGSFCVQNMVWKIKNGPPPISGRIPHIVYWSSSLKEVHVVL